MPGLDLIKDQELRNNIDNSIEYIYAIYEESKDKDRKKLYVEETYRVIILYVVSVIEAILIYFYKERGEVIEYSEYKFIQQLPVEYMHKGKIGSPVIVAVQEKMQKKEYQIGLYDLITHFKNKKLILPETADKIINLNDVRNTLHLSKPRTKNCDINNVEMALKMLVRTIEKAPLALRKTK